MRQSKTIVLWTSAIALVITLFPPWTVRERALEQSPFGPEKEGGHSFILTPPTRPVTRYYYTPEYPASLPRTYDELDAKIDIQRLMMEYVLFAVIAGVVCAYQISARNGASQPAPIKSIPNPIIRKDADEPKRFGLSWYQIPPLAARESAFALMVVLSLAGFYAVFMVLLLPPSTPSETKAGVLTGGILGAFGICAFAGWLGLKVFWILSFKSPKAARFGFYLCVSLMTSAIIKGTAQSFVPTARAKAQSDLHRTPAPRITTGNTDPWDRFSTIVKARPTPQTVRLEDFMVANTPSRKPDIFDEIDREAHNESATRIVHNPDGTVGLSPEDRRRVAENYLKGAMTENQRAAYEEAIRRGLLPNPPQDDALSSIPGGDLLRLPWRSGDAK